MFKNILVFILVSAFTQLTYAYVEKEVDNKSTLDLKECMGYMFDNNEVESTYRCTVPRRRLSPNIIKEIKRSVVNRDFGHYYHSSLVAIRAWAIATPTGHTIQIHTFGPDDVWDPKRALSEFFHMLSSEERQVTSVTLEKLPE